MSIRLAVRSTIDIYSQNMHTRYFTWPGLFILNFVKKKIRFITEIIYILLFLYQMVDIKHWGDIFMEIFTSKCIYDMNLICIDNFFIRIDYVLFF